MSYNISLTAACTPTIRHYSNVWNKSMVKVVLVRSLLYSCCTHFGQRRSHLVNTSKRNGLE